MEAVTSTISHTHLIGLLHSNPQAKLSMKLLSQYLPGFNNKVRCDEAKVAGIRGSGAKPPRRRPGPADVM